MKTQHWKNIVSRKNPHNVDARDLYRNEHAWIVHLLIKPGEELKPHKTPVDVAFYVLEGKGLVLIGEETKEVEAGTVIDSPRNITHCWYNKSDQDLRVMVIKAPNPESKTKIS